MKSFIIISLIIIFSVFTLSERNQSTCGELCGEDEQRLYHDIDKNTVKKKKKRKKSHIVV